MIKNIYQHFSIYGTSTSFTLNCDAMKLFSEYHDNEVIAFRKKEKFSDLKCMILAKAVGNILRVGSVNCVLRQGLNSINGDTDAFTCSIIEGDDIKRACIGKIFGRMYVFVNR